MFCVLTNGYDFKPLTIGTRVTVQMRESTLATFGTSKPFTIQGNVVNICWSKKGEGTPIRNLCVLDDDHNMYVIRYHNNTVLVYTDSTRELYDLEYVKMIDNNKPIRLHDDGFGIELSAVKFVPLEVGAEIKHKVSDRVFKVVAVGPTQFVVQSPDEGFLIYTIGNVHSHFDNVQYRC